jgi:hypothetical protein
LDTKKLPPQLIKALEEDRLVFFFGAGVSQVAGLPSTAALASILADELEADFRRDPVLSTKLSELAANRSSLQRVAQMHAGYYDAGRPYSIVADSIASAEAVAKTDFMHPIKNLLAIREILTTNYDCLIEKVVGESNCQVIYRASDLRQGPNPKLKLFKLHGTRTDVKSMVLTTNDYSTYDKEHLALAEASRTLLREKLLVVVGFSMEDDNFGRIYNDAVEDDGVRTFFVSPEASLMQELHWAQKGFQHIAFDAKEFFRQLGKEFEALHYKEQTASFTAPETPPVPTGPLTNPFVLFDTEALIEDQPRFLFQTFVKPVDFPVLLEHQHTIIEGQRLWEVNNSLAPQPQGTRFRLLRLTNVGILRKDGSRTVYRVSKEAERGRRLGRVG